MPEAFALFIFTLLSYLLIVHFNEILITFNIFQLRKHSSSISFCDENIDGSISRKEFQLTGSVKFSTYKTYFKAAHSRIFNMIVFILFIAAQIAWSGSDFLLSKW